MSARVVVITGAAGNLGRAVAQVFAAHGAHLALLDRNADGIEETIQSFDGQASAWAFRLIASPSASASSRSARATTWSSRRSKRPVSLMTARSIPPTCGT